MLHSSGKETTVTHNYSVYKDYGSYFPPVEHWPTCEEGNKCVRKTGSVSSSLNYVFNSNQIVYAKGVQELILIVFPIHPQLAVFS